MRIAALLLITLLLTLAGCTPGKRSGRLAQPITIAEVVEPGLSRAVMSAAVAKVSENAPVVKADVWSAGAETHKVFYFHSDSEVGLNNAIKWTVTGTSAGHRAAGQRLVVEPLQGGMFRTHLIDDTGALTIQVAKSVQLLDSHLGLKEISIKLIKADGERFHEFTKAHVGKKIAIMIGDRVQIAPVLMEAISGGSIILSLRAGNDGKALMQRLFEPQKP